MFAAVILSNQTFVEEKTIWKVYSLSM